jgi:hypothetical protein
VAVSRELLREKSAGYCERKTYTFDRSTGRFSVGRAVSPACAKKLRGAVSRELPRESDVYGVR